ncbi:MAG: hypothetical protein FJ270_06240 [Planctomycetes bacterium]|nr:hypothetical protein [Planctomycetota bacterium]
MNHNEPNLDPRDAHIVDQLVQAGWDPSKVTPTSSQDADALRALVRIGTLLNRYPTPAPDDALIDATLLSVERADADRTERMALTDTPIARSRWRLPDFISVAACLLLLIGVAVPMANQARNNSSRALCADGFRELGSAFTAYSTDSKGNLPMAAGLGSMLSAGTSGDLPTSMPADNAQAVRVLAEKGYCRPGCLHCAGVRQLSFRVPLHATHIRITTLVLSPLAADANPLLLTPKVGIQSASPNHGGEGQNVLFSDGAVVWMPLPFINIGPQGRLDNMWTLRGVSGGEGVDFKGVKFDPYEVFLGQ